MSSARNEENDDDTGDLSQDLSIAALVAFIEAPTWGETSRILAEKEIVLLTGSTCVLLLRAIDHMRQVNDPRGAAYLEQHLQLLADTRTIGAVQAWQHFEQQREHNIATRMVDFLYDASKQNEKIYKRDILLILKRFTHDPEESMPRAEDLVATPIDAQQDMIQPPFRLNCATPYFKVLDILEHHQALLEQFHSWNESITWLAFKHLHEIVDE